MANTSKIHLLSPSGKVVCNSRHAKLTTQNREEATCGVCKGVGIRANRDAGAGTEWLGHAPPHG